jgi:hypothetical protein
MSLKDSASPVAFSFLRRRIPKGGGGGREAARKTLSLTGTRSLSLSRIRRVYSQERERERAVARRRMAMEKQSAAVSERENVSDPNADSVRVCVCVCVTKRERRDRRGGRWWVCLFNKIWKMTHDSLFSSWGSHRLFPLSRYHFAILSKDDWLFRENFTWWEWEREREWRETIESELEIGRRGDLGPCCALG